LGWVRLGFKDPVKTKQQSKTPRAVLAPRGFAFGSTLG
jgi:hypothetical protein